MSNQTFTTWNGIALPEGYRVEYHYYKHGGIHLGDKLPCHEFILYRHWEVDCGCREEGIEDCDCEPESGWCQMFRWDVFVSENGKISEKAFHVFDDDGFSVFEDSEPDSLLRALCIVANPDHKPQDVPECRGLFEEEGE